MSAFRISGTRRTECSRRSQYASNVDAYDPKIPELLIELEEVHNDFSVDERAQLLARIGHRHVFI
ncbi:hypothetical protein [Caballeronia sordidicola]|uniref:Uncharacterized protein n=1 Tax=Caballeronia sordidicola TaxID=196367 RepID=A0A226WQ29_CABSO|nr:hypothetical protein [Caballeronia sordidicola]OXC72738.1 hypothetical protein BSU04_40645 [Caballeronia sordidicola]